ADLAAHPIVLVHEPRPPSLRDLMPARTNERQEDLTALKRSADRVGKVGPLVDGMLVEKDDAAPEVPRQEIAEPQRRVFAQRAAVVDEDARHGPSARVLPPSQPSVARLPSPALPHERERAPVGGVELEGVAVPGGVGKEGG